MKQVYLQWALAGMICIAISGCAADIIQAVEPVVVPVQVPGQGGYHAYGDSITAGATLASPTLAYPTLISTDRALPLSSYANSGDMACDVPTRQIFPSLDAPTTPPFPVYTLMIGTNDQDQRAPSYLSVFNLCHQASIAWLGLPSSFKILATSAAAVKTGGGTYNNAHNWNLWRVGGQNASISFPLVLPAPGPIYAWVRIADNDPGAFSYAVDGTVLGIFTTATAPAMTTSNGSNESIGLIRIPNTASGSHVVKFTQTSSSGTVQILGVATAPPAASALPVVVVGDPPNQGGGSLCEQSPPVCAAYVSAAQANVALFAGDGLNIIYAENHTYMFATPSEMNDQIHPNPLGQSELRHAFEAVLP